MMVSGSRIITVLLALASLFALTSCGYKNRTTVIWTAPSGSVISYIRGSNEYGHVFVVTEKSKEWVLWDVALKGTARKITDGKGSLSPLGISQPNVQNNRLLLTVKPKAEEPRILLDCDLVTGNLIQINEISNPFIGLDLPYSSDGRRMILTSASSIANAQQGVWIKDSQTQPARKILSKCGSAAWGSGDHVYAYSSATGELFIGKPDDLCLKCTLPAGFARTIPDMNRILIMQIDKEYGREGIRVYSADTESGQYKPIYEKKSEKEGALFYSDIQYSASAKLAVVCLGKTNPIVLDANDNIAQIKMNDHLNNWLPTRGVTLFDPSTAVIVEKVTTAGRNQYRLVAVSFK